MIERCLRPAISVVRHALALGFLPPAVAFAAHPLATEDTGVQGKGNWQFELNTDRAVERNTYFTGHSVNAALTYGVSDGLDLAFNVLWQRNQVGDAPPEFLGGTGDASVFMKWRAYEDGKLSLAVKPMLSLPTGNFDKGLGSDRLRPSVIGIATWGDEKLSLSANLGYTYNNNKAGERKNIWNTSVAVMAGLGDKLKGVAEVGTYTNSDPASNTAPAFANVGLIYSPTSKLDFDIGYKRGLNDAECHHSVGAGVTVRW